MSADKYIPGLGKQFFVEPEHVKSESGKALSIQLDELSKSVLESIKISDIGEGNRKIKVVACVIRNDGTGWKFIEGSNHSKLNVSSITANTTDITINFNFTAKNILSFVATPDETFAVKGYSMGASVGTNVAILKIAQLARTIGGYIFYNGSGWTVNSTGGNIAVSSYTAGKLLITHDDVGAGSYLGSAVGRAAKYDVQMGSLGGTSTEIEFYNAAGTLITTPTTDMKVFLTRSSVNMALNPQNVIDGNGNIWCIGVFEV
jgi:hypothetical protein